MRSTAELLAAATPRTKTVSICLRGDLVDEHEQLTDELEKATRRATADNDRADLVDVVDRIEALEARIAEESITFRIQSLSRSGWRSLLDRHPPTADQAARGLDHDERTFSAAAIAACVVDPDLTEAEVAELADVITAGGWIRLWTVVLEVNLGTNEIASSPLAEAIRNLAATAKTEEHLDDG